MAVWQFVCDLIPASAATVNGVAAVRMSGEQLDGIALNFSQSNAEAIVERVGMLLPEKRSLVAGLRVWGDEKTDDVQIAFCGAEIEQVQFRLTVAGLSLPLVVGICALARDFDCVLAEHSGAIIRPDRDALFCAILQSDAARYVSDPQRFLRELSERSSKSD